MESMHQRNERANKTAVEEGVAVPEEAQKQPGIEEYITSEIVLGLLGIPTEGLLKVSSALLIGGNNEVIAYWWRDPYSGQQHAEFRDPVQVKAILSDAQIDSGYLPPNVLRLGLSHNVQWLALYVPPGSYDLIFNYSPPHDRKTVRVGLPGFVLAGRGREYWMWAVKRGYPSPHTPVYHMPLPNIGGGGILCFGENAAPAADGPTVLQAVELFLASPFNDHWALGKAWSQPGDIRELLCVLATRDDPAYPEEELVPITPSGAPNRELTLDQILKLTILQRS